MLEDVSTLEAYKTIVSVLFKDRKFKYRCYVVLKQFTHDLCQYHHTNIFKKDFITLINTLMSERTTIRVNNQCVLLELSNTN